jgi:lysophospholipase L1-like esterase
MFRLAAIAFGLALVAALELALRALGWGGVDYRHDPYAGIRSVQPLFVADATGDYYRIARSRRKFFRPEQFKAEKPDDEFRIFCLGGSTVQGRPFAIETSFTTWLEIDLEAADPSRAWNVINCGGISYASYRLVPILQEILNYQPDLVIVCTGQNEFLEDRTYGHLRSPRSVLTRAQAAAGELHLFRFMQAGYRKVTGAPERPTDAARPILPGEVQALLDFRGGLEYYQWDPQWRREVVDHYRFNLNRMAAIARQASVPMIFVEPVSNLRDCPPFKSQHRGDLTPEELTRWNRLYDQARRWFSRDKPRAVELLKEAIEIDAQHAGLHYTLAKCYDELGQYGLARTEYLRAKERDVCPLRMIEPLHEALREVAGVHDVPRIDLPALFEVRSSQRLLGGDWLIDHVHPSIPGHQLIAQEIAKLLVKQGVAGRHRDWEQRRAQLFDAHLQSLGDNYYQEGLVRLENVRAWAEGRSDVPPPKADRNPRIGTDENAQQPSAEQLNPRSQPEPKQ